MIVILSEAKDLLLRGPEEADSSGCALGMTGISE
jgi:hypothetical protein